MLAARMLWSRRFVCAAVCSLSLVWAARQHVAAVDEDAAAQPLPGNSLLQVKKLSRAATGEQSVGLFARVYARGSEFTNAFLKSFTAMCVAEIFDRTWFVTLICALNYGSALSFASSITALALHTIMAVSFGETVAYMLPKWCLELLSAAILGAMAIQFAWECYQARPGHDAIKSRREEAQEEIASADAGAQGVPGQEEITSADAGAQGAPTAAAAGAGTTETNRLGFWQAFATVFTMIFLAEWGDRTQIVQITLAASLPPVAVILGSLAGLCLLGLSACVLARFIDGWEISERALNATCAISFGVMAVLAVVNARAGYLAAHTV